MTRSDNVGDTAKDRATVAAARWLVTLDEAPDDAELRARFEAWLSASPENAAAWADTADIYELMAKTHPAYAEHWARYAAAGKETTSPKARIQGQRPPSTPRPRPRRSKGRRIALAAAAAALAACIAVAVVPPLLLRLQADHVTSTAELRSFDLADGSRVHLAPDSALALDFNDSERLVRLLKGQAFFEVALDPERPFRLVATDVTVRVLGTAFDVRLGDRGAAVAVRHGRVGVGHAAAQAPVSLQLEPGDWVQIGWDGDLRRGWAPPDEAGSWLQGQIVVRDRPLADAVDDLRRYYAGFIVLTDGSLGARRVSGVYNLDDPVAALTAMAGAHGGVVRQVSPWVLLVSAE